MDRIASFLKLDSNLAEAGGDLPQNVAALFSSDAADSSAVTDDASSATSSDESFERVSTADLAEYDATATEAKTSPADAPPDQANDDEYAGGDTLDPATEENQTAPSPADPLPTDNKDCDTLDPAADDTNARSSGDLSCQ